MSSITLTYIMFMHKNINKIIKMDEINKINFNFGKNLSNIDKTLYIAKVILFWKIPINRFLKGKRKSEIIEQQSHPRRAIPASPGS